MSSSSESAEEEEIILLMEQGVGAEISPTPPWSARATPASALRSSVNTPAPDYHSGSLIDIQGIDWSRTRVGRSEYRLERMRQFHAFEVMREIPIYVGEDLNIPHEYCEERSIFRNKYWKEYPLYTPQAMNTSYPCTVQHFQLRHLLGAPNIHTVVFTYGCMLMEWDPITNAENIRFNMRDYFGADCKASCLGCNSELVLLGGMNGEMLIQSIDSDSSSFPNILKNEKAAPSTLRITNDSNGLTNGISDNPCDASKFVIASNDSIVRSYDANLHRISQIWRQEAAVNFARYSPCGRLISLASDCKDLSILDLRTNSTVALLAGHIGYNFSCDWHPNGYLVASGNEDHTCRIFDLRKTPPTSSPIASQPSSLHVLGARMAAVRNVKFSPDGTCLASMEESDFVTIYDVSNDFRGCTSIDYFGESAGIAYAANGEFLYIGCGDADRGGVIELKRPYSSALARLEALM